MTDKPAPGSAAAYAIGAEVERLKRVVASMDDDLAARSREWAMEHGEDEDAVWTAVQFIEHYAASTGEGT